MRFDDDADLDTSEVQDVRGSRIPGGRATVGGGLVGVIALLLGLFFGVGPDNLGLSSGSASPVTTASSLAQVRSSGRTGRDANVWEDCRIAAVVNSVQDHWAQEFRRQGGTYTRSPTVFFSGQVATACGTAASAVGPFYCPGDRKVYLDLGFFDEPRTKFGSAAAQDGRTGANRDAVRVELQADCYAGVWAHHATATKDESTGRPLITSLTDGDIRDGLDAAAAVGDGRIQERFQGRVTPETWTHGSTAQRQQWFQQGFRSGGMARCDTFR
ncbi:neutral zinc metallopeptidase [Streptomyces sp. NPDC005492]|uniref:neutral zinc metallopeptidase n=1 Tax=Streptomyces sp. NPDC005492 TaxID=3156883 RepID=UPI0033B2D900